MHTVTVSSYYVPFPLCYSKDKQTEHTRTHIHTHITSKLSSPNVIPKEIGHWGSVIYKKRQNNRYFFLLLETGVSFKADWNPELFWATSFAWLI